MEGHEIVAAAGVDDVRAAAAVDGVVARTGRDDIGRTRPRDPQRRREDRGVQVLEVRDLDIVARGLIDAGGDGEIDGGETAGGRDDQRVDAAAAVNRDFRAVVRDRVVARARGDDVGAGGAVDRIRAGAAGDDIGA